MFFSNSRRKDIEKELNNLLKIEGFGSGTDAVLLRQIRVNALRGELDREDRKVSRFFNFVLTLGNIALIAMQILHLKR